MSWIEELAKTYDVCIKLPMESSLDNNRITKPLLPQYHQLQNSTLEIIINNSGSFLGAKAIVEKSDQKIIIPCTEQSAARTTNDSPHPLCDKIQYLAADYKKYVELWLNLINKLGVSKEKIKKEYLKNKSNSYYESYYKQQKQWLDNTGDVLMLNSIHSFLKQGSLLYLLFKNEVLKDPILSSFELTFNEDDFEKLTSNDDLFYTVIAKEIILQGYEINNELKKKIFSSAKYKKIKQEDKTAFNYAVNLAEAISEVANNLVRFKVENPNDFETRCWKNTEIINSWVEYCSNNETAGEVCYVSGTLKTIAKTHPKGIIDTITNAKLISANDSDGYTFRGRFLEDFQACSVSAEISHKAHSALKYLISRQGFSNGTQVVVSWAVSGKEAPDVYSDSLSIFNESDEDKINEVSSSTYTDAGQNFARKLAKKIAGYKAELTSADNIVVMGLDSAGPGRISITYYRELNGSDFLERIENWHKQMAWLFKCYHDKKQKRILWGSFELAPSPESIAEACYGAKRDEDFKKFKRSVIERLLPCIIDGRNVPFDLVQAAIKKASNPLSYSDKEKWQWEQALSVACALYTCYELRNNKTNKTDKIMALENERTDRDYLYGRLLAVAEHLEEAALRVSKEQRETTAARLMQRFADFPFPTWRTIEAALVPYKSRLQSNRPGVLYKMKELLDEIHSKFQPGDYEKDGRLSGAFLLGYHCQRLDLSYKKPNEENETENNN